MANLIQVTVTTAHALNDEQKKLLRKKLNKKLGRNYQLKMVVNKATIGGLKLTINGQIKDATISNQADNLTSQLNQVKITTAVPLTAAQLKKIKATLKAKYGDLDYQVIVDPNIIGGIKLSVGFNEYDATLKSKLDKIKTLLLKKI